MTKQAQLKDLLDSTSYLSEIDTPELSDFQDADGLREYIEERIREHEVIYYASAMDYLRENDPSLRDSLGYASDMGFSLDKLNSETLATIHKQESMIEELSEIDFDELFETEEE